MSKQQSDNPGKRNTNYLSFKTNYGYKDGLASMGSRDRNTKKNPTKKTKECRDDLKIENKLGQQRIHPIYLLQGPIYGTFFTVSL